MAIAIKPLTPELLPDWLHFFDNVAFTDNPDWADCYCCCYQLSCSNEEWGKRTKAQNRQSSQEFIRSGKMKGYLAFENSSPVGWCNVNNSDAFYRIPTKETSPLNEKEKVAAIICFIIAHGHRGKGIARQLLQQVIRDCETQGYNSLEAYPRTGVQLSPASQFHGPLALYLSEGFEIKKKHERYAVVWRKF